MFKKAFRLEGYVICFVSVYTAWFPVIIHHIVVILCICMDALYISIYHKKQYIFYYPS